VPKNLRAFLMIIAIIHLAPFSVMCCGEIFTIPVATQRINIKAFDSKKGNAEFINRENLSLLITQEAGDSLLARLSSRALPFIAISNATS